MSKNVKAMFEGKQYDLAIKYGLDSDDVTDKLYVLSAMMILGKELDAINFINSNVDSLYEKYPLKTLNAHFELLLKNKLYKDAYKALKMYEDKPYVSQEVEELLRDLKERIQNEEHPSQKGVNGLEEVNEVLEKGNKNADVARVLFALKEYNFNGYVESLEKVIKNPNVHPSLRTYGLIVMVENSYKKPVSFLKGETLLKVIPAELTPPFLNESQDQIMKHLHESCENNVSLENTAIQLLNYYTMDIYPEVIKKEDTELVYKAIVALARKYLQMEEVERNEDVLREMGKIELIINSTPTLDL